MKKRSVVTTFAILTFLVSLFFFSNCKVGPMFELSSLTIEPAEVVRGDSVDVSVGVANSGDAEGTCVVTLEVDGVVEETREVTLPPAASETVSFTVTKDLGSHTVTVQELIATFEVIRDTTPPETVIDSGPQGEIDYSNISFQWSGNDDRSPKSELTYSYYLENYDDDYSPFGSETSKIFATLPEGSYTFYVRAQDLEGNIDPSPAKQAFTITMPWDIVVRPGVLAKGEKVFPVHIPLPPYDTVVKYVPRPIIEERNIYCWIDEFWYWWAESDGERYMHRVKIEYRIKVNLAKPDGIYDVGRKYHVWAGGGTDPVGILDFNIRVKVSREEIAQAPQTEEATQAPPTGERLMYEDDFSNPDSGWLTVSWESSEAGYEDGEYHILVKASDWPAWYYNTVAGLFADFRLEADARLVSGPNDSTYGLVFRLQDTHNFYHFLVSGNGYYHLGILLNDGWTELQYWTKSAFIKKGNSTNHLEVVCKGSQIKVYVNGHHLTTVTDGSFGQGYVGMIVDTAEPNARVAFDNIRVYGPD